MRFFTPSDLTYLGIYQTTGTMQGYGMAIAPSRNSFFNVNPGGATFQITEGQLPDHATNAVNPISTIGTGSSPTITTLTNHNMITNDVVVLSGTNCTPSIDGTWVITKTGVKTFTVTPGVSVTGGGSAGTWKPEPVIGTAQARLSNAPSVFQLKNYGGVEKGGPLYSITVPRVETFKGLGSGCSPTCVYQTLFSMHDDPAYNGAAPNTAGFNVQVNGTQYLLAVLPAAGPNGSADFYYGKAGAGFVVNDFHSTHIQQDLTGSAPGHLSALQPSDTLQVTYQALRLDPTQMECFGCDWDDSTNRLYLSFEDNYGNNTGNECMVWVNFNNDPPTAKGPWKFNETNTGMPSPYNGADVSDLRGGGGFRRAPQWVLNARQSQDLDKTHLMWGARTNTYQDGSWGPGLLLVKPPADGDAPGTLPARTIMFWPPSNLTIKFTLQNPHPAPTPTLVSDGSGLMTAGAHQFKFAFRYNSGTMVTQYGFDSGKTYTTSAPSVASATVTTDAAHTKVTLALPIDRTDSAEFPQYNRADTIVIYGNTVSTPGTFNEIGSVPNLARSSQTATVPPYETVAFTVNVSDTTIAAGAAPTTNTIKKIKNTILKSSYPLMAELGSFQFSGSVEEFGPHGVEYHESPYGHAEWPSTDNPGIPQTQVLRSDPNGWVYGEDTGGNPSQWIMTFGSNALGYEWYGPYDEFSNGLGHSDEVFNTIMYASLGTDGGKNSNPPAVYMHQSGAGSGKGNREEGQLPTVLAWNPDNIKTFLAADTNPVNNTNLKHVSAAVCGCQSQSGYDGLVAGGLGGLYDQAAFQRATAPAGSRFQWDDTVHAYTDPATNVELHIRGANYDASNRRIYVRFTNLGIGAKWIAVFSVPTAGAGGSGKGLEVSATEIEVPSPPSRQLYVSYDAFTVPDATSDRRLVVTAMEVEVPSVPQSAGGTLDLHRLLRHP